MVKSVLNQSYEDFELILCDDGSDDDTMILCKKLAKTDARIKVLGCEHKGVSATRNAGIDAAKGDWIAFVDSDDRLLPVFLESMLNALTGNNDTDIVFGSYGIVNRLGVCLKVFKPGVWTGKDEIHYLISNTGLLERCSPWAKLYRRSILVQNDIKFDTRLSHSEDRHFIYRYLRFVQGVSLSGVVGYLYGNFSSSSLKYQKYGPDTLMLRQQLLTDEGVRLLSHFEIPDKECFSIGKNLLHLIEDACLSIGGSGLKKREKAKIQKLFINEFFSHELKDRILADTRILDFVSSSKWLPMILEGDFMRFNRTLERYNRILLIKRWLKRNLSGETCGRGFESSINILN